MTSWPYELIPDTEVTFAWKDSRPWLALGLRDPVTPAHTDVVHVPKACIALMPLYYQVNEMD